MAVSDETVARVRLVEIRMADGETIDARLDQGEDEFFLGALHERLATDPYVRFGDTVVRSGEIRLLRLKDESEQKPGLMKSLLGTGEEDEMSTIEHDRTGTMRSEGLRQGGRAMHGGGFLNRPHAGETTPFFWTSEFLALLAGTLAIAICTAVFDGLDVRMGLILITALAGAYILSRGIAKAGTPYRERNMSGVNDGGDY